MISKNATHFAFAFLVIFTAISWGMNAFNSDGSGVASNALIVATIAIGFFKAGVIIAYFMEVKDAPRALQAVMGVWVIGVCLALTGTLVVL